MPLFGCKDWAGEDGPGTAALHYLDGLWEAGTPVDVGLPEDVALFPVSVNKDVSVGVFMLHRPDVLPERWWWIGEGSSSFFPTFVDLLAYVIGPLSSAPREYVD
ncbi:hypothetical protein [Streptomyces rochei]|uniref:hypothetical protein n=1 Tax=Streptomyces rochei TaxID=1928 RepID=UPI003677B199